MSLRHSALAAPEVNTEPADHGAAALAQPGVPGRAVLELRDGLGGVRPAHRAGAAVRRRGAGSRRRLRGLGAGDVRDRATSPRSSPAAICRTGSAGASCCIVGLTVSAAATVLVGFTSSLPVFLAAAFVTGAATGIFISPQQAAVADIVGNKARGGTAVATFQMMADLGAIVGSLAVGQIARAHLVRLGVRGQRRRCCWSRRSAGCSRRRRAAAARSSRHPVRALGPEAGGEVP